MSSRSTRTFWAAILAGAGVFGPLPAHLSAQVSAPATQSLLDKAHALEARGRMDMAVQTWQQVLLADPNNVDALAGLARVARMSGKNNLAGLYLDRLRAINPSDPNLERIASIEPLSQPAELTQAGKYAQSGQYEQAMVIYRRTFGDNPPPGDWALAYYETESATADGRPHAIAGLRSLVEKYPNDSRYQIALGRTLAYTPETRAEGRRLLEKYSNDPQATEALHQSLAWDTAKPSPASNALIVAAAARAQNKGEAAAYAALNAGRLDEAGSRFKGILAKEPHNPRALAGLGYVRMQKSNFSGAVSLFEQAKQYGARDASLDSAIANAQAQQNLARVQHTTKQDAHPQSETAQLPAQPGGLSADEYQRQQIALLTQKAQSQPLIASRPLDQLYGPYVPYIPPPPSAAEAIAPASNSQSARQSSSPNPGWGYTPTPTTVQLGDATPHIDPPQKEVTDVLPTARYMPNAHLGSPRASLPTMAQNVPADELSAVPTTVNVRYKPETQPQAQTSPPLPQPQTHPHPQPKAQSGIGTYGQQYPQPGLGFGRNVHSTRRRPTTSARASHPAPHPAAPPVAPQEAQQPSVSCSAIQRLLTDNACPSTAATPAPAPTLAPAPVQPVLPMNNELAAKNPPPLSGASEPAAVVPSGPSEREKAELERAALESAYSGWVGGTGIGRYRAGNAGFDKLVDIESPFEASAMIARTVRATVVARGVFLSSGVVDNVHFQNRTGGVIPIIGTLPGNVLVAPQQQSSYGLGGEFQLTTQNIGAAVGYTPYDFLVSNITARFRYRPLGGPISFYGERDSVKDTQLSYSGMRDPGTITPLYSGNIWGGVISTGGGIRLDVGNERARMYANGGGAVLTGYHVIDNRRYDGNLGVWFLVHRWPGRGRLNLGADFSGMHYDHNERGLTYGHGGYFSPNMYFLAAVPVTYEGSYRRNFHYNITGSLGVESFQEDRTPYYPLDRPLQTGSGNAFYALRNATRPNYRLDSEAVYRFSDHWFLGGFLLADNVRDYNQVSGGFFVRYTFKPQVATENVSRGFFPPNNGFRPFRIP